MSERLREQLLKTPCNHAGHTRYLPLLLDVVEAAGEIDALLPTLRAFLTDAEFRAKAYVLHETLVALTDASGEAGEGAK